MPRLPRETKVDGAKCHACHAKRREMSPSATPATQNEGGCHQVPRLPQKRREMSPSATPATQNEGGCHQVQRLPRKVPRRHRRLKPPQAHHQSHLSAISATPATQNAGGCHQVPRLPRETKMDVTKCHACHAKCRGVTGD